VSYASVTLQRGSRLGPYEIVSPLGAGGMGEVYRAKDPRLNREVAIKILPAGLAAHPERLKRFEREARSASGLSHPNIVTIYDFGREGETSYIAMELVGGESLRAELLEGAVPVASAISEERPSSTPVVWRGAVRTEKTTRRTTRSSPSRRTWSVIILNLTGSSTTSPGGTGKSGSSSRTTSPRRAPPTADAVRRSRPRVASRTHPAVPSCRRETCGRGGTTTRGGCGFPRARRARSWPTVTRG
jgi:hypothetical protein